MLSPVRIIGSKYKLRKMITDYFPPHDIYVEVFGGGATILFYKQPAKTEIYNDIENGVYTFFKILNNPVQAEKLRILLAQTLYSREMYNYAKFNWRKATTDFDKAYLWFVTTRQSFMGAPNNRHNPGGWRVTLNRENTLGSWNKIIENFPDFVERFLNVIVENKDFKYILQRYDSENTFFYLDPPYPMDTRRSERLYTHEMKDEDHMELLLLLRKLKGKAILSGQSPCKMYDQFLLPYGWTRKDFSVSRNIARMYKKQRETNTAAKVETVKVVESIWLSPGLETLRGKNGA